MAEALISLDRITDVITHLNPKKVINVSLGISSNKQDQGSDEDENKTVNPLGSRLPRATQFHHLGQDCGAVQPQQLVLPAAQVTQSPQMSAPGGLGDSLKEVPPGKPCWPSTWSCRMVIPSRLCRSPKGNNSPWNALGSEKEASVPAHPPYPAHPYGSVPYCAEKVIFWFQKIIA